MWFLASDLGRMLELSNIRYNLQQLKESEKEWCYIEPEEPEWPDPFKNAETKGSSVSNTYAWSSGPPENAEAENGDVTKSYDAKTGETGETEGASVRIPDICSPGTEGPSVTKSYTWSSSSRGKVNRKKVRVVNEAGLYKLIFMSRTPSAKAFQDWVVSDVLPAIRKTGKYKLRKTTASAFMPKDMSDVQQVRISVKERYRHLSWITAV